MFKSFKNLTKKISLTMNSFLKTKEIDKINAQEPSHELFNIITNESLTEQQMLKQIEEKKVLKNTPIQAINEDFIIKDDEKMNVIIYCFSKQLFLVAVELIKLEGVMIDKKIHDTNNTILEAATKLLFLADKILPFFGELFSKPRVYQENIFYPPLAYVALDAPNEKFILNFVNTFNIDLTKQMFVGGDILDYLQEREDLTRNALKGILNTNQFSKKRLEDILNTEINPSEISDFRTIVEEKLIEMEKNELNQAITIPESNKTKTTKKKI